MTLGAILPHLFGKEPKMQTKCMAIVFRLSSPFKVFHPIVCLVSIYMIDSCLVFWIWDKSFRNQSVNKAMRRSDS